MLYRATLAWQLLPIGPQISKHHMVHTPFADVSVNAEHDLQSTDTTLLKQMQMLILKHCLMSCA